jgi:L-fucose mutarotase
MKCGQADERESEVSMLKNMPRIMTPELMTILMQMGHSDEIALVDGHFPGYSCARRHLFAPGAKIPELLDAILHFFPLETKLFAEKPAFMMAVVKGDSMDPELMGEIEGVFKKHAPDYGGIQKLERMDFMARARNAFAIVSTGELRKYSNVILTKGLAFPEL